MGVIKQSGTNILHSWHTKDLEVCLDERARERTVVGASFSMECLLRGEWYLSGCGVAEMGRNFGRSGHNKTKTKTHRHQRSDTNFVRAKDKGSMSHKPEYIQMCFQVRPHPSFLWRTQEICPLLKMWIYSSCCACSPPVKQSTHLVASVAALTHFANSKNLIFNLKMETNDKRQHQ